MYNPEHCIHNVPDLQRHKYVSVGTAYVIKGSASVTQTFMTGMFLRKSKKVVRISNKPDPATKKQIDTACEINNMIASCRKPERGEDGARLPPTRKKRGNKGPGMDVENKLARIALKYIGHKREPLWIGDEPEDLTFEVISPVPGEPGATVTATPHQTAVIEAAMTAKKTGRDVLLIQGPAGTGKTFVAKNMTQKLIEVSGGNDEGYIEFYYWWDPVTKTKHQEQVEQDETTGQFNQAQRDRIWCQERILLVASSNEATDQLAKSAMQSQQESMERFARLNGIQLDIFCPGMVRAVRISSIHLDDLRKDSIA